MDVTPAQIGTRVTEDFVSPLALSGIARLAAKSPLIAERKDVQYFSMPSKSLLNRCSNPDMPFQWTINPYRGCEFACKYCYARYTHEFMELRAATDFERLIYAKQNATQHLAMELSRLHPPDSEIALGTSTDPYQPAERQFCVTRQILQLFSRRTDFRLSITTKSNLILRDIDLLQEIARRNSLRINFSITTVNAKLARTLEPRAPSPDLRFKALERLVRAGLRAGVLMMPLLPAITTPRPNLDAVIKRAGQAKAAYLHASTVFLMPSALALMLPFLDKHFPHLRRKYEDVFRQSPFLSSDYQSQVMEHVHDLQRKYGVPRISERDSALLSEHHGAAHQLELGF